MQLFHAFDFENMGSLDEEHFLGGWRRMWDEQDPVNIDFLRKMKGLVGRVIKIV